MSLSRLVAALVAAITVVTPGTSALAAQTESSPGPHPTLEDLFTVRSLGAVEVAPDGDAVLYTVTATDLDENEQNSDIWLIRREGSAWTAPVQLTRHDDSDSSPRWHADGNTFAFLSSGRSSGADGPGERGGNGGASAERGQKIYLMDVRGGEPQELVGHVTSISTFAWSPDGSRIAFRATDEESDEDKDRQESGRDVIVEDDEGRFSHLWVFDMETEETRRITEGASYTVGSFDWSPDGTRLAFSATPTGRPFDSWKSDVYVVSAQDLSQAPRRVTSNPGPDNNPAWTPDGEHIVYSGQVTDRYQVAANRVFRIPAEGGSPEDISPNADFQPGGYTFTADGRGAFFGSTTGTTRGLFYVDLDDRTPVRLTPDAGVYTGAGFSKDRQSIVYLFQNPQRPVELYATSLGRPEEGSVVAGRALTTHNDHAIEFAVGKTEVLRWKGTDGRDVEGIVVYPTGWSPGDGPRATVVKIHGGPSGVYVENFQAASSGADAQRYAADGYAVLLPNPRGSSGYGEDGLKAVVQDWGGLDFQDIMTGVDTLIARGVSHPDSLGVMGWSYGGYMTAWTVTQTSRFKAAVAGAAITENIAMWGTQDIQHVFEAYFGGGPYEPGMWEVYQRSNPLAFVDRATTPTLVIHGENDPRVPPNQARIFYRALKANGVETKLLWLPRTGHGPREPGLQYERTWSQKEWMDRWIRRRPTPTISELP